MSNMTREEAIRDIEECVLPYVGGISLHMAIEDMKEMDRLSKAVPVLKEPDRPHGDCRDRLKEVFREYSSISGDMFHLYQIENIIDGEDWL